MKIRLHFNAYFYLAILLLILPVKWLIAWIIAVCFHEACHYLAVKLCGGENYNLRIDFGGAVLTCSQLSDKKHLFSLLAGPLGGFLFVLLGRWFPRVALCSWILSVYNLLPLLPLDGGQALRLLMKNSHSFYYVERVVLILLTICGVYVSVFLHFGVLPVAIVGMLWVKNRNSPCKEPPRKVQ